VSRNRRTFCSLSEGIGIDLSSRLSATTPFSDVVYPAVTCGATFSEHGGLGFVLVSATTPSKPTVGLHGAPDILQVVPISRAVASGEETEGPSAFPVQMSGRLLH